MAELKSITETTEAITAEAVAYVWEAYDAPRKRVPRARIVEHTFTVSIPKLTEEAAPLAFVIEHFPEMTGRNLNEYRAGYDQPIRHAGGKFYTPARMDRMNNSGRASSYMSTDPREHMAQIVSFIDSINDYTREEYAEAIERHEIRADEYPARYPLAEDVAHDVDRYASGYAVIDGEIWLECNEPAYMYDSPGFFGSRPGYFTASAFYSKTDSRDTYGATDRAAMAYRCADATRYAFIRVIRPDLVTIDETARDLARKSERLQDKAVEIREQLVKLQKEFAEAQAEAAKARAELDSYTEAPRAYWIDKAERLENIDGSSGKRSHLARKAAAIRRAIEADAV